MNYIKNKYKSIKENWLSKTPKEKWSIFHKMGDVPLSFLGLRTYSDNKICLWSYSSGVNIMVYVALVIYTITIYITENDFKECLNCVCVSGGYAWVR